MLLTPCCTLVTVNSNCPSRTFCPTFAAAGASRPVRILCRASQLLRGGAGAGGAGTSGGCHVVGCEGSVGWLVLMVRLLGSGCCVPWRPSRGTPAAASVERAEPADRKD